MISNMPAATTPASKEVLDGSSSTAPSSHSSSNSRSGCGGPEHSQHQAPAKRQHSQQQPRQNGSVCMDDSATAITEVASSISFASSSVVSAAEAAMWSGEVAGSSPPLAEEDDINDDDDDINHDDEEEDDIREDDDDDSSSDEGEDDISDDDEFACDISDSPGRCQQQQQQQSVHPSDYDRMEERRKHLQESHLMQRAQDVARDLDVDHIANLSTATPADMEEHLLRKAQEVTLELSRGDPDQYGALASDLQQQQLDHTEVSAGNAEDEEFLIPLHGEANGPPRRSFNRSILKRKPTPVYMQYPPREGEEEEEPRQRRSASSPASASGPSSSDSASPSHSPARPPRQLHQSNRHPKRNSLQDHFEATSTEHYIQEQTGAAPQGPSQTSQGGAVRPFYSTSSVDGSMFGESSTLTPPKPHLLANSSDHSSLRATSNHSSGSPMHKQRSFGKNTMTSSSSSNIKNKNNKHRRRHSPKMKHQPAIPHVNVAKKDDNGSKRSFRTGRSIFKKQNVNYTTNASSSHNHNNSSGNKNNSSHNDGSNSTRTTSSAPGPPLTASEKEEQWEQARQTAQRIKAANIAQRVKLREKKQNPPKNNKIISKLLSTKTRSISPKTTKQKLKQQHLQAKVEAAKQAHANIIQQKEVDKVQAAKQAHANIIQRKEVEKAPMTQPSTSPQRQPRFAQPPPPPPLSLDENGSASPATSSISKEKRPKDKASNILPNPPPTTMTTNDTDEEEKSEIEAPATTSLSPVSSPLVNRKRNAAESSSDSQYYNQARQHVQQIKSHQLALRRAALQQQQQKNAEAKELEAQASQQVPTGPSEDEDGIPPATATLPSVPEEEPSGKSDRPNSPPIATDLAQSLRKQCIERRQAERGNDTTIRSASDGKEKKMDAGALISTSTSDDPSVPTMHKAMKEKDPSLEHSEDSRISLQKRRQRLQQKKQDLKQKIVSVKLSRDDNRAKMMKCQLQNLHLAYQEKETEVTRLKNEVTVTAGINNVVEKNTLDEMKVKLSTTQEECETQARTIQELQCRAREQGDEIDTLNDKLQQKSKRIVELEIDLDTHDIHYTQYEAERREQEYQAFNEIDSRNKNRKSMDGEKPSPYELISKMMMDYSELVDRYREEKLEHEQHKEEWKLKSEDLSSRLAVLDERLEKASQSYPTQLHPSADFMSQRVFQLEKMVEQYRRKQTELEAKLAEQNASDNSTNNIQVSMPGSKPTSASISSGETKQPRRRVSFEDDVQARLREQSQRILNLEAIIEEKDMKIAALRTETLHSHWKQLSDRSSSTATTATPTSQGSADVLPFGSLTYDATSIQHADSNDSAFAAALSVAHDGDSSDSSTVETLRRMLQEQEEEIERERQQAKEREAMLLSYLKQQQQQQQHCQTLPSASSTTRLFM